MFKSLVRLNLCILIFFLSGCQIPDSPENSEGLLNFINSQVGKNKKVKSSPVASRSLSEFVSASTPNINVNRGFNRSIRQAVQSDPVTLVAREKFLAQKAAVGVATTELDFKFSSTVYGGIEDVTEKQSGLAIVLQADKLIYDGGKTKNTISAQELLAQALYEDYKVEINESAKKAIEAWIELDRYATLNNMVLSRLETLGPILSQLEQVADAGVSDVTKVMKAKRTIAEIKVVETEVAEFYDLAKISFLEVFGNIPQNVNVSFDELAESMPTKISKVMVLKAPNLLADYARYKASLFEVEAVKQNNNFNVGFQTSITRPFAGSERDRDEKVGLVANKPLLSSKKLKAELEKANAKVEGNIAILKAKFRQGYRFVETNLKTIESMNLAIDLAKTNVGMAKEEIKLLRRQLVIGQSSLENVLSAEASLFQAESVEVNYRADREIARVGVLSALGLLSEIYNISAVKP